MRYATAGFVASPISGQTSAAGTRLIGQVRTSRLSVLLGLALCYNWSTAAKLDGVGRKQTRLEF